MTFPIALPPDGDTSWGDEVRATITAVNDHEARLDRGLVTPTAITYAATITPDAAVGALFRCTATGDLSLNDPTGGSDGQLITVEIVASGAARTLTVAGAAVVIPSGEKWTGTLRYDSGLSEWLLLDSLGGGGGGTGSTDPVVIANTQSGTAYTLALSDAGKAVEMTNAAANTVTVPPASSVAWPTGAVIDEILQYGAGQTSITAGSGVTIRPSNTVALRTRYSSASLRYRGSDEWVVSGDYL